MNQNSNQKPKDLRKLAETLRLITDNFRIFVEEVIELNNAPYKGQKIKVINQ